MSAPAIPVHHLHGPDTSIVRVEHIRPAGGTVENEVHRHDFHEIFIFATGSGEHMIDLEPVPLQPPCVHLVAPGQVHQLTRSADTSGLVVMFGEAALMGTGQAASALFHGEGAARSFTLGPAMLEEVRQLVAAMEQELARSEGALEGVVLNYLGILLMKGAHWRQPTLRTGPPASDRSLYR